jgi:hypothetical protein
MNKIPTSQRLFPGTFTFAVFCLFLLVISGCGPQQDGGGGGKPQINQDTIRNHVIPISLAIQYTKSFRDILDSNMHVHPKFVDSLRLDHGEMFPSDLFYDLLAQSNPKQGNAKGIRIYFGRDPNGQLKLVLVPVDSLGNDIINHLVDLKAKPGSAHVEALQVNDGQAGEVGQICPTACDNGGSGLNP